MDVLIRSKGADLGSRGLVWGHLSPVLVVQQTAYLPLLVSLAKGTCVLTMVICLGATVLGTWFVCTCLGSVSVL